ncbi:hypothetical protein NP233_g10759 [Leucocoprinus birnbaumii]|uniref:Uncharacterized protein n=1 Tax=Leucocoprinus birnbaumii TaxID=56174 RepID=A0AAD5VHN3_9AGAR|nr:hypothetical protein NP233_g10759 [Leucocoprinus birnbaumii]
MPFTPKEITCKSEAIPVIVYKVAQEPARLFQISTPFEKGHLWFWLATEFTDFVNWPETRCQYYNVYYAKFLDLGVSPVFQKNRYNPYFIIKPANLPESECFELTEHIQQLKEMALHLPRFVPTWMREPEPEPPRRLTPPRLLGPPFAAKSTGKQKREHTPEIGSEEWITLMDKQIESSRAKWYIMEEPSRVTRRAKRSSLQPRAQRS